MTGSGLSEHDALAQLIAAEKASPDPPVDVERRVFSRLSASLALPPVPDAPTITGPAGPPAVGPVGRGLARLSRRGVVTFLAGAAAGAATYGTVAHLQHEPVAKAPRPVPVSAPAPQAQPAPTPTPPDIAPVPSPAAAPRAATAPRASERELPPAAARDRGLAAERKLIEMARTALGRGQTDDALATLRRHARSFPTGQLAEERDSLLVHALVAKGEYREARQRAIRFREQYPTSLFGPVVDQAVRSIP